MRYVREEDAKAVRNHLNLSGVGNIHVSGSVRGMQLRYGWPKGGQVRVGQWIYNVGPSEVSRLRNIGILRGERQ